MSGSIRLFTMLLILALVTSACAPTPAPEPTATSAPEPTATSVPEPTVFVPEPVATRDVGTEAHDTLSVALGDVDGDGGIHRVAEKRSRFAGFFLVPGHAVRRLEQT